VVISGNAALGIAGRLVADRASFSLCHCQNQSQPLKGDKGELSVGPLFSHSSEVLNCAAVSFSEVSGFFIKRASGPFGFDEPMSAGAAGGSGLIAGTGSFGRATRFTYALFVGPARLVVPLWPNHQPA